MAVAIPYTPPQFSNSLHLALTTAKDLSGPAEFNLSNTFLLCMSPLSVFLEWSWWEPGPREEMFIPGYRTVRRIGV